MNVGRLLTAGAVAAFTVVAAHAVSRAESQAPAPAAPQGAPPAPAGRGQPQATFPSQQRAAGDPALIERGKGLYTATCVPCHGADLRGGVTGGPNLLRSAVALNDQAGELIAPILRGARAERGMPAQALSDDDVKAVAEYIHSVLATTGNQGRPPATSTPPPNIVVGDASAGQKYFGAKCASCHSASGDMQGIATRVADPKTLQNLWVSGGMVGGRGRRGGGAGAGGANPRAITVTVTPTGGQAVKGRLVQVDNFIVTLAQEDGTITTFRRDGDRPKVEIADPLAAHKSLLSVYTDKDMHDVTAYLVTLK